MPAYPIYEFYAELKEYAPKIWRRFQIGANVPFSKLAYVLMTLFEMQASHLCCFTIPDFENFLVAHKDYDAERIAFARKLFEEDSDMANVTLEFMFEDVPEKSIDITRYTLKQFFRVEGEHGVFEYDFGDGWEVEFKLLKIINDKELSWTLFPRVLEGEGYGIIEDCGGPLGLQELAEAYKKKSGREYKEFCSWLGIDDLDLTSFDLDDMNFRLKKVPRIYGDIYEYDLEPTKRAMKILNRDYKKD